MSNVVSLTGRLTDSPKVLGDGKVTKLNVASNWKDYSGKERTFYASVAAFGKLGELCAQYLEKGREVHVIGKLETSKHEKDGVTRSYTDIIADSVKFIGSNGEGNSTQASGNKASEKTSDDEDLPF